MFSDADWIHFFIRTKRDITQLTGTIANTIVPEKSTSRSWSYSLNALPSEKVELALLAYYLLTSLLIAQLSVRLCRLLSTSKLLGLLASLTAHTWSFYGETWRDVSCTLRRRKIPFPIFLDTSSSPISASVHFGLGAAATTMYVAAILVLFRDMAMARGASQKMGAYARLSLSCIGLLWFCFVENVEDSKQCRNLNSHIMHSFFTNAMFLWVLATACGVLYHERKRNKKD